MYTCCLHEQLKGQSKLKLKRAAAVNRKKKQIIHDRSAAIRETGGVEEVERRASPTVQLVIS